MYPTGLDGNREIGLSLSFARRRIERMAEAKIDNCLMGKLRTTITKNTYFISP